MREFVLVEYDEIDECLAEFLGVKKDKLEKVRGKMEWETEDGEIIECSKKKFVGNVREQDCWGWVRGKSEIHFWFEVGTAVESLVAMLAHELGHMERPFYKEHKKEEKKACKYGRVALEAYRLAVIASERRLSKDEEQQDFLV